MSLQLFNVGDGGGNPNVRSDSLIRVQVWSAIAYGSRGLYYYCPSTRHLISQARLLAADSAGATARQAGETGYGT